jgi:hypothetical protein
MRHRLPEHFATPSGAHAARARNPAGRRIWLPSPPAAHQCGGCSGCPRKHSGGKRGTFRRAAETHTPAACARSRPMRGIRAKRNGLLAMGSAPASGAVAGASPAIPEGARLSNRKVRGARGWLTGEGVGRNTRGACAPHLQKHRSVRGVPEEARERLRSRPLLSVLKDPDQPFGGSSSGASPLGECGIAPVSCKTRRTLANSLAMLKGFST